MPAGYRLLWTGQYAFLAEMEARLRYVIPLTLVLVVMLLHPSMRGPMSIMVGMGRVAENGLLIRMLTWPLVVQCAILEP